RRRRSRRSRRCSLVSIDQRAMNAYWNFIAACWLAFVVYWTESGLRVHRPKRSVSLVFTVPNTALLYVGFVLVLMQRFDVVPLSTRVAPSAAAWVDVFGAMLVVAGLTFAVWARVALGRSWSATVRILADQRVVRGGPYAFVAHPIYSGISLALL